MGEDKSLLTLQGQPVIVRIFNEMRKVSNQLVVNQKGPRAEELMETEHIADLIKDSGPLGGLHAVMKQREEDWFAVTACDTPFIRAEVFEQLLRLRNPDVDAIVPLHEGRFQPTSAVYHRRILPLIESSLKKGERKVRIVLDQARTTYSENFPGIDDEALSAHFFNMNTPEDYLKAVELAKK